MKTQPKTKTTPRRARKQPRSTSKVVTLVHAKRPVLRHFRLVEHKHTGKLIHLKHTSHLALVGILIIVGFFLFISENNVLALTQNGDVTISVVVPGPPPTIGAVITSPLDGDKIFDKTFLNVSGTCQPHTFVVVYDNDQIVGSDTCTDAGFFGLQVQIEIGKNVLTAMDFDNLNQPGPVTPAVTIISAKKEPGKPIKPVSPISPVPPITKPILPINPSIIPGIPSVVSSCDKFKTGTLPTGGDVHVSIVCIPRLFGPKTQQVVGILVWGGISPYAINIDWGDGLGFRTINIPAAGYYTQSFNYAFPGIYRVEFLVKDKNGDSAAVQSSVQVNGVIPTATVTKDDSLLMSWLRTPVPLYIMAVTITLGFWGGDIFIRRFGVNSVKHHRRTKKAA